MAISSDFLDAYGRLPSLRAAMQAADDAERGDAETAERSLLYVAATRAKQELVVLSFGEASVFLG